MILVLTDLVLTDIGLTLLPNLVRNAIIFA